MILTVGDSFTYGSELADRRTAWPYLLGRPVKNLGLGGSSNDRIFRTVVEETSLTKFDLVVVAWAFPNRKEVFNNTTKAPICINYTHEDKLPWVRDYFKFNYDKDFAFRQWLTQIVALQGYLKSIGQKYIFCNVAGLQGDFVKYSGDLEHLLNKINKDFYVGWPYNGMLEWAKYTPIGPGGHFLEEGHKLVADKINEHIRNLGWVS